MRYVTLDEVKDQVSVERLNNDATLESRLTRLATAAEDAVANFLNADLEDYEESPAQSPPEIPEAIKSGILLYVEMEYDRNVENFEILKKRAEELLWPYRVGLEV